MKIWFLWDGALDADTPGSYELRRFMEVGQSLGHEIKLYDPRQFKILCGDSSYVNIFIDGLGRERPDAVMGRMGSATTYLCHAILRHMQSQGIVVINESSAISASADKLQCMQILSQNNIPIPSTMFARCPVDSEVVTRQIGYPVIVKTLKGTQGGGVYLCETPDKLRDLSEILVHQGLDDSPVLFQQYIESSHGTDLRVFVVDGKVLACMKRAATDGSFKSNITRGGVGEPYPINEKIEKVAVATTKLLGLEIAGIDLLFSGNEYVVCEANSAPDFKGLETYCHVSVPEAVFEYIEKKVKLAQLNENRSKGLIRRLLNFKMAA